MKEKGYLIIFTLLIFLSGCSSDEKFVNGLLILSIDGVEYQLNRKDGEATVMKVPDREEIRILSSIVHDRIEYPVTYIHAYDFTHVKTLHIPASIKKISWRSFKGANIENVYIEDLSSWCNIEFEYYIDPPMSRYFTYVSYASPFTRDTKLYVGDKLVRDMVLPDDVEEIPNYAFRNLSLGNVNLSNVKKIGMQAFEKSTLTKLNIGGSLAEVGMEVFSECDSLEEIVFDSVNPEGLYLGYNAFNCDAKIVRIPSFEDLFNIEQKIAYVTYNDYNFTLRRFGSHYDLVIGNEILKDVVISGIEVLKPFAFDGSTITSVVCHEGLREIQFGALSSSTLKSVILPSSLKEIDSGVFGSETERIELNSVKPPFVHDIWFNGMVEVTPFPDLLDKCELIVPAESLELYKSKYPWSEFVKITGK